MTLATRLRERAFDRCLGSKTQRTRIRALPGDPAPRAHVRRSSRRRADAVRARSGRLSRHGEPLLVGFADRHAHACENRRRPQRLVYGHARRRLRTSSSARARTSGFEDVVEQLQEYFARRRTVFTVPISPDRHAVSTTCVDRAHDHPLRRDAQLRSAGRCDWQSICDAGRRRGQRPKPDQHHRAVPSRHREQRHARGLWRRARAQEYLLDLEHARSTSGTSYVVSGFSRTLCGPPQSGH